MNKDFIINLFLKMVEGQLKERHPIVTTQTYHRLTQLGYSDMDAKKMIASCLSMVMNTTIETEIPFDSEKYSQLLDQLPALVFGKK